ncbi:MAG: hypothetical protein ABSF26_24055 [Thermoguttaceae bacterium]|jgi:hypothetical protein
MSTLPIKEGFLPLAGIEKRQRQKTGRLARALAGGVRADLHSVPRYLVRYSALVLALFGVLSLWEAQGDGRIPGFTSLLPPMGIDPSRVSSLHCAVEGVSDEVRWQGLTPALKILDHVNPQVAAWLRQKHADGSIAFFEDYRGTGDRHMALAKYDRLRRRLIVNHWLFCENDGTVAAILCHEYRHARQSLPKLVRCALSFIVTKDGDPSILENDAVLYEQEANFAIFGK